MLGRDAIIGVSCYDSLQRAREAAAAGADYLAFGAFFPSATKPNARRATPALLRDSAALGRPRVAIGGITPDNAPGLVAAGADWQVRETFESALEMGREALERLGDGPEEATELMRQVRERDRERFALETVAGNVEAGAGLLIGNAGRAEGGH